MVGHTSGPDIYTGRESRLIMTQLTGVILPVTGTGNEEVGVTAKEAS